MSLPGLMKRGVCLKLLLTTCAMSALVAFGNDIDTICLSACSPLFVATTRIVNSVPSAIVLSESETLLSTGLGFGAVSAARYEWGRTYADSAKYAAAAATAMIIIDLMTSHLPEPFKSLARQL